MASNYVLSRPGEVQVIPWNTTSASGAKDSSGAIILGSCRSIELSYEADVQTATSTASNDAVVATYYSTGTATLTIVIEEITDDNLALIFDASMNASGTAVNVSSSFCYLNDIVLAAMALADAGRRVLFLDIDVHHSDGVQHAFYARRDVMVISLHESGKTLFPGTGFADEIGEGEGRGFTVNIPLPVGTSDGAYEHAFRQAAWPLIEAYDPDVIVVELGMDTLAGDPLAHLHLTNNVPADIVKRLVTTGKPILATGGGGYHVENTVRGWTLCWSVLCGEDATHDLMAGMGGVMLENTDWLGGLRDRVLLSDAGNRGNIDAEIEQVIRQIRATVFPIHGLA